jgi:2-polyprenyl-3-methyl-5-hydroxy-6-metoxy-1,4-benzoquinol methylase
MTVRQEQAVAYGKFARRMLAEAGGPLLQAAEPAVLSGLQARLDELLAEAQRPVQLLDAGCGKHREIPIADDCYVVGVDISSQQLENNTAVDEAILGDIQACELGRSRFDAVVCWYVLEHVDDPRRAILNMKMALKPGGVMILAVPHAFSVKGLVTRFTPFWFHGWVWHHVLGRKRIAQPFPTVMAPMIAPQNLGEFARENGLSVEFLAEYEGWEQKKLRSRLRLTGRAFKLVEAAVRALSFGKSTVGVTDALIVLRNQGEAG